MESDDSVTEILEVPGQFQKPHEIFISEQTDWSFENGVKEETDPLCLEEEEDSENMEGGGDQSTPWQPEKTIPAIKEDPIEPPNVNLQPSDLTVKQEKDSSDLPPNDSFTASDIPFVKEMYCSTTAAFSRTRSTPASENVTGFAFVKTESSPRHEGYDGDVWPGGALGHRDWSTASRGQKADDDIVEVMDHSGVCSGHRKRIRYPHMITMAIMDSPNWRMTLSEIYRYTMKHFPGVSFRRNWQNSIRHVLSVSWHFVKTAHKARGNAHYWSLVPSLLDRLQEELCCARPHCCRWQMINEVHRDCSRPTNREPPPPSPPSRRRTSENSTSSQKNENRSPRSSSGDVCRISIPLRSGRKNSKCSNSSQSIVDSTTDLGDGVDRSSKVVGPKLPLTPLIATSIMLSPDSENSTSSQKNENRSPRSSSEDVLRISIPLRSGRKNSKCSNSSQSIVDSTADLGDWVDRSSKVVSPTLPLTPLIATAIMLSPDRRVPLSVIYTYCMRRCPYYKDSGRQFHRLIQDILESEACFQRVPKGAGGGPDCWTFDPCYDNLLVGDTCQPSGALVDDTSSKPWEHDHGLYPKQLLLDPDEASAAREDAGRVQSPDSQITDTASEPNSDTDEAQSRQSRERLRPSPQVRRTYVGRSRGGARKRNKSTVAEGESELGCSTKRPRVRGRRLESLPRDSGPHSDYPFPDEPVDEHDVLDIKEEPLCEELPTENICAEGKGEENMCTTLLDADGYKTVKIKQEKEEYPITVKYEMVGTWC